jgi:hypothetical protein
MLHKHLKPSRILGLVAGVGLLGTAVLLALPGTPDSAVPGVLGRHLPALNTAIPQLDGDLIGETPLYASMLWIDW